MNRKILIIGCGDTGKRVIQQLSIPKKNISAVSHRKTSQDTLASLGIKAIQANLDDAKSLQRLPTADAHIFYFAPPPNSGAQDSRMKNFIHSLDKNNAPQRIVYISTTGVYGDCKGKWIDEETPTRPLNDRSKRRFHAESAIVDFCQTANTDFVILRVSGIYCLEKLPIERLQQSMKVLDPNVSNPSNRIHADDLAHICIEALYRSPSNEIFNVADGSPSSISDYFIKIAATFQLPQPALLSWKQAESELSPAMLSYLHESKKVSCEKLKKVLGISLKYPSLSIGLDQCYDLDNATL